MVRKMGYSTHRIKGKKKKKEKEIARISSLLYRTRKIVVVVTINTVMIGSTAGDDEA